MSLEFIARNGIISRGNIIVTGSLTASGSLALTNIGSSVFSGSITQIASTASFGGLVNIGTTASRFDLTIPNNGRIGSDYVLDSYITLGNAIGLVANYNVYTLKNLAIGAGDISARLGVKGSGTTSSTTALLVQNSAGTNLLSVTDAGLGITINSPGVHTLTYGSAGNADISINSTAYGPMLNTAGTGLWTFGQWGGAVSFKVGTGGAADRVGYNMQFIAGLSTGNTFGGDFVYYSSLSGSAGSSIVNTQNEIFRIKYDGRVGIGTATPSASLHISGSSNSALLEIDSPAVNNILYVSGSGNVGIGTGTPARTLEVFKGGLVDGSIDGIRITVNHNSATAQAALEFYHQAGPNPNSRIATDVGSGGLFPSMYFFHNGSNRIIITSGGNVLIGTSTNSARLAVQGSGATSSTTAFLVQNSNLSSSLQVKDDGSVIASNYLQFASDGAGGNYLNFYRSSANSWIMGSAGIGNVLSISGNSIILQQDTIIQRAGLTVSPTITSPSPLTVNHTWNDASTVFATLDINVTNTLSQTGSKLIDVSMANTSSFVLDRNFNLGIKTSNPSASLHVVGNTILSGSAGSGSALSVYKSGSTVVDIQGSSGQLFSVTDSLTGSLFSVNTVAGLPVMEAFSDNTVNIGKFNTYPIKVVATGSLANITGSFSGSLVGIATTASYVATASYTPTLQQVTTAGNSTSTPVTITGTSILEAGNVHFLTVGYGSSGQFQLRTAAGSVNAIRVTNTGLTGIGTTSPSAKLHVVGSGTTSSTTALLIQNANTSSSLAVLDNGFVGIGTSAPTNALSINGNVNFIEAGSITTPSSYGFVLNSGNVNIYHTNSGLSLQNSYWFGGGTNIADNISATQANTNPATNGSVVFQISSTRYGFLLPRTNLTSNISAPAQGLQTYITASATEGIYYYNSGSYQGWTRVLNDSGSQVISGSLTLTNALTASSAVINGNVTVLGTASIAFLNVTYESASVIYSSGSNQLGDALDDTQTLYGNVIIPTGSLIVTGSARITGSLTQIGSSAFSGGTYSFVAAGAGDGGIRIDNSINGYTSFNWLSNTMGLGLMAGGGLFAKVSSGAGFHVGNSPNSTFAAVLTTTGHGTTTGATFIARNSIGTNILRVVDSGLVGINNAAPSASLHVAGNTILSGSAGTGSALQVYKSGSTVMSIQGSQGELFSITDSLSGSLFSVSNISGLPILEVFSDNTTLVGDYLAPALITTKKTTVNSGSTVIYNLPTASYDGGFFDYTIRSGSNARAGQIMAIWSGTSVNHTEIVTSDFGNTNGFTFGSIVSGSNMALTSSASTSGWTLKTIIRSI